MGNPPKQCSLGIDRHNIPNQTPGLPKGPNIEYLKSRGSSQEEIHKGL